MADLTTEKLSVDMQENIISTAEPVAISSSHRQLRSKGLRAALKDHHLTLGPNVRGTLIP
jgi:LPS export ABC transporter protein LptC